MGAGAFCPWRKSSGGLTLSSDSPSLPGEESEVKLGGGGQQQSRWKGSGIRDWADGSLVAGLAFTA